MSASMRLGRERGGGHGIGMWNVQRRLQGLFGPDHGLAVYTPPEGGTRVELRIPWRLSPRAPSR